MNTSHQHADKKSNIQVKTKTEFHSLNIGPKMDQLSINFNSSQSTYKRDGTKLRTNNNKTIITTIIRNLKIKHFFYHFKHVFFSRFQGFSILRLLPLSFISAATGRQCRCPWGGKSQLSLNNFRDHTNKANVHGH